MGLNVPVAAAMVAVKTVDKKQIILIYFFLTTFVFEGFWIGLNDPSLIQDKEKGNIWLMIDLLKWILKLPPNWIIWPNN